MTSIIYIFFIIAGGKTPDVGSRTYTEIMKEQYLRAEETEVSKNTLTICYEIFPFYKIKYIVNMLIFN